ncbi:interferon alpha-inducible protein 27-like protein 2A [Mytilus trossulus]|uniref:interferon alpha-inducible protein 27-like protein 2A n=1 Tax=Mytilus trossulus TaxID=6551 RepID=UPI003004E34B
MFTNYACNAESEPNKILIEDNVLCVAKKIGGAVVIGTGAVALVPVALSAAGLGNAGIPAGSLAAKAMAISGVANGGGVVAGGVVAGLQSAGAAGLGVGTTVAVGTTFGGVYRYSRIGCSNNETECIKKIEVSSMS